MSARTYGWLPVTAAVAAALCLMGVSPAQTVISARAGLLSHTDGCVLLDGEYVEFQSTRLIHLVPGQRLRTDDGYAEVMLGPEVFLRLGMGSEIEMMTTDLESPQVRLWRGSVLIDANGLIDRQPVSVWIRDTEIRVIKKGLYRLDVPRQGPEALSVWNGRAVVAVSKRRKSIGGDHVLELGGDPKDMVAHRAQRPKGDPLEEWNRQRASAIAWINGEMLRKQAEEDREDRHFPIGNPWGILGTK